MQKKHCIKKIKLIFVVGLLTNKGNDKFKRRRKI